MGSPRLLFISYCQKDKEWLNAIREAILACGQPELLDVIWCDQELKPADEWRAEILEAIGRAKVGLLVVSESFHSSAFISLVELPLLLEAYREGRVQLTWVRIDDVDFRMRTYAEFQAALPPEPPLKALPEEQQKQRLRELATHLVNILQGRPPGRSTADAVVEESVRSQRKGRLALGAIAAVMLLGWCWATWAESARPDRTALLQLLHGRRWIGYEPARFDPDRSNTIGDAEIAAELRDISAAGFDGIVTFGAREDLARIPALADERGLDVIMGVWNPLDQDELRRAYEQRDVVDAYCVGHNCLGDDRGRSLCTERDLERSIRWLRRHTGRPVTTTQLGKYYQATSARLNLMGDFLFPDLHHNFSFTDVDADVRKSTAEIERVAAIAEQYDRPLMLKTMTYPVRLSLDAEPDFDKQRDYFAKVLMATRDPLSGPRAPVAFVLHSAFDESWKQGSVFLPWDPFTGLFDRDGRPRPAVLEWMWLKR